MLSRLPLVGALSADFLMRRIVDFFLIFEQVSTEGLEYVNDICAVTIPDMLAAFGNAFGFLRTIGRS